MEAEILQWCRNNESYLLRMKWHRASMAADWYVKNIDRWLLDKSWVEEIKRQEAGARKGPALPSGPTVVGQLCEQVKALHLAGMDTAQISRHTGYTAGSVTRALAIAGATTSIRRVL